MNSLMQNELSSKIIIIAKRKATMEVKGQRSEVRGQTVMDAILQTADEAV